MELFGDWLLEAKAFLPLLATLAAVGAGLYPVWRVSRLAPAGLLKTQ